ASISCFQLGRRYFILDKNHCVAQITQHVANAPCGHQVILDSRRTADLGEEDTAPALLADEGADCLGDRSFVKLLAPELKFLCAPVDQGYAQKRPCSRNNTVAAQQLLAR